MVNTKNREIAELTRQIEKAQARIETLKKGLKEIKLDVAPGSRIYNKAQDLLGEEG